jgi:putative component of membrane protein insertase Oxa1/YidC/SpoIIIJ protein YidD
VKRRRVRPAVVALAFVLLLLALDLSRAPGRQWTARAELMAIARYRAHLSPWLARAGTRCRFTPSCSRYAEAAIRADGALVGTARAGWRVLRCGPWTAAGTLDPP